MKTPRSHPPLNLLEKEAAAGPWAGDAAPAAQAPCVRRAPSAEGGRASLSPSFPSPAVPECAGPRPSSPRQPLGTRRDPAGPGPAPPRRGRSCPIPKSPFRGRSLPKGKNVLYSLNCTSEWHAGVRAVSAGPRGSGPCPRGLGGLGRVHGARGALASAPPLRACGTCGDRSLRASVSPPVGHRRNDARMAPRHRAVARIRGDLWKWLGAERYLLGCRSRCCRDVQVAAIECGDRELHLGTAGRLKCGSSKSRVLGVHNALDSEDLV